MKAVLVFSFLCAVAVSGYFFLLSSRVVWPDISPETGVVSIGDRIISVLVADTPELRERGLSGRTSLPKDSGMFFIMDSPDVHDIWMKEMHFPIDILWIDDAFRIVTIQADASPDSYPKVFYPTSAARYVLELNAGYSAAHEIVVGDEIVLEKRDSAAP